MPNTIPMLTIQESPGTKDTLAFALDQQTWPLKIYTLGRLCLVRDGVPLHFSRKVPRKPLELLKALIAFGGRGASENRLIDCLWPDAEGGCATRSFSSALHRLRQLLGDNRFIQRQESLLTLDNSFCWVDAWTFERLSKLAQSRMQQGEADRSSALQTAQLAIAHYRGHFLPADADKLWSIGMRERLRGKMLNLITMVGQHSEAASDWHTALAVYQKGLETDDLYEEFYQRQMICHHQMGNHGGVASVYQRCCTALAMIRVTPSPRTNTIYKTAISSK